MNSFHFLSWIDIGFTLDENDIGFTFDGNDICFRGAPSGYFGESSGGTFNPSWYLNDLGTMYKRVSWI